MIARGIGTFLLVAALALAQDKTCWDLLKEGSYDKAIVEFRKELKKYPKSFELIDGIGWCYYYQGEYVEAEARFEEALLANPEYGFSKQGLEAVAAWRWEVYTLGASYYAAGSYEAAEATFVLVEKDRTDRFPKDDRWRLDQMIGWCQLFLGRAKEAEARFQAALKVRVEADLLRGLARAQLARGRADEALATWARLAKIDSPTAYDRAQIGWAKLAKDDVEGAIDAFRAAVAPDDATAEAHLGLGLALARGGKVAEAKASLGTAVDLSPTMAQNEELGTLLVSHADWIDLRCRIGWSWYRLGYSSYAYEVFAAAVAASPADAEARTGLGFALYAQASYDAAIAELDRALALGGRPCVFEMAVAGKEPYTIRADARTMRAWCWVRKGEWWKALPELEEAVKRNTDWVDALCGLGWARYGGGKLDAAADAFLKAQKLAPSHLDAATGLASIAAARTAPYDRALASYQAGDFEGARMTLEAELGREGRQEAWKLEGLLGWCLVKLGKPAEGLARLQHAFNDTPKAQWGSTLLGIASALYDLKRYDEAIEALEQVPPKDAASTEAYLLHAWCRYAAGEPERAATTFEVVLASQPSSSSALLGLGLCRERAGKADDALVLLQRALVIAPALLDGEWLREDPLRVKRGGELLAAAGWGWYYAGSSSAALACFEGALADKEMPTAVRAEAQVGLGLAAYAAGDYARAAQALSKEAGKLPSKSASWDLRCDAATTLARAQYAEKSYEASAATYARVLACVKEIDAYPALHAELGWCHLELKSYEAAEKEFLAALRLSSENETALAGLKRLASLR